MSVSKVLKALLVVVASLVVCTPSRADEDIEKLGRKVKAAIIVDAIVKAGGKVMLDKNKSNDLLEQVIQIVAPGLTLEDQDLENFCEMPNLCALNLTGTRITGKGLQHLKNNKNLAALGLAFTGVDDASLVHLQALPNLQVVDLRETTVTDEGLMQLTKVPSLRRVLLSGNHVTEAGMKRLGKSCPKMSVEYFTREPAAAPAPAAKAAPPVQAKDREALEREAAAEQERIRSLEEQINKCLEDARKLDELAAQARRDNMGTSAAIFAGQAGDFRQLASEFRGDIAKANRRIAEIRAELAR